MSQKVAEPPTQPAFVIRPAKRKELEDLIEVYKSGYEGLEEYAERTEEDIRDYLEWLYDGDPNGFLVAEANGELIGFVSVHSDWWDRRYQRRTAEIHELVVRKDWQGKGVGRALMMVCLGLRKGSRVRIRKPLGRRRQLESKGMVSPTGL
jgi:GNAT superfamily N-acetyltransferase